ncbi:hypothetical protein TNIN_342191 [Trichonephila inaurata madagascariensis]|uniref:Mos1 transposase HTH domain-containing protein n=1 Tax=Trichonephila inaurata madagascariensis TaxID=2747483 RepID=A0A8X6XPZ8_9ARAC|nr:hypothetical protein TNIN_342191 [Trichonephila inaurata madagascariensis]
MDQKVNMLFCFKLGKSAKGTHEMLKKVYKYEAITSKSVYEGRTSLEDAPELAGQKLHANRKTLKACGKRSLSNKAIDCGKTGNRRRKCSPHIH